MSTATWKVLSSTCEMSQEGCEYWIQLSVSIVSSLGKTSMQLKFLKALNQSKCNQGQRTSMQNMPQEGDEILYLTPSKHCCIFEYNNGAVEMAKNV